MKDRACHATECPLESMQEQFLRFITLDGERDIMQGKSEKIRQYWDNQGKLSRERSEELEILNIDKNVFRDSQGGTLKDPNLRECEIRALDKYVGKKGSILDVGCGNGYSTIVLARRNRGVVIKGTDYSHEMITSADEFLAQQNADIRQRVRFAVMDVLQPDSDETFDVVMTQRCLINIETWEKQKKAIQNIDALLKEKGLFLMLEGTLQGLESLNKLRNKVGLESVPVSWHNLFFDEVQLIDFINEEKGLNLKEIDNFCSTYMMISRVVHPAIMEPSYDAKINKIALEMPNYGDNGYLKIFVIEKVR